MMNQNQQPPLTGELTGQILNQLKQNLSRVEGEITTMRADSQSGTFQNIANMFKSVFDDKARAEGALKVAQATLEKIYGGHPDIKIKIEADARDQAEKMQKAQVKINKPKSK